jgi:hypothetical protein
VPAFRILTESVATLGPFIPDWLETIANGLAVTVITKFPEGQAA